MSTTSDINSATYDAINSSNQGAATAAKAKTASLESSASAQDRFLKLLTAQLKNQDPLNPLDNAQMTSQLAQISTVDGITKLNSTMQAMLNNSADSQTFQAAALVGHAVLVPGNHLALKAGQAVGGVDMAGVADNVVATIKDANGLVVRTLDMDALPAGTSNFAWDGKTDDGADAAEGAYTVSFAAKQGGEKVEAKALEYGAVTSVARSNQGVTLTVGSKDMVVSLADVRQII
ncbi:MAG: flagellar hook assembly protein FlgD [Sterolibacterium sp.]|jgi:flagellar basal-body rod modification protein FlgD|nr:flagellar hook assembly protein FlgD [Sterolibacterium sp.]